MTGLRLLASSSLDFECDEIFMDEPVNDIRFILETTL